MSHNHTHHHGHNCSCSHNHEHAGNCCKKHKKASVSELTTQQQQFLQDLTKHRFLPVTQFVIKSSKQSSFECVALAPVYILGEAHTIDEIKQTGKQLKELEDMGYITLDYDIPIKNFNYDVYYNSDAFKFFKDTVDEGKDKQGYLGDMAIIQTGSIAFAEHE